MLTTTLNEIAAHGPCLSGWKKLLSHLGKTRADDESLPYVTILESNGFTDAAWAFRRDEKVRRHWQRFVLWDMRRILHKAGRLETIYRVNVVERAINGVITDDERISVLRAILAEQDQFDCFSKYVDFNIAGNCYQLLAVPRSTILLSLVTDRFSIDEFRRICSQGV